MDANKDKQEKIADSIAQTGKEVHETDLPIKNAANSTQKNTASETPGLNQTKTNRDDLMPSDGDNLTI